MSVFDTLKFARNLEKAGMPREQAEALALAIDDSMMELFREEGPKAFAAQRSNLTGRPRDKPVRDSRPTLTLMDKPWIVAPLGFLAGMVVMAAAVAILLWLRG
jgi:hypothetical protein